MGGYGSTRWGYRARRCTIEESLRLRCRDLKPHLADSREAKLALNWTGRSRASIGVTLGPEAEHVPALSNPRRMLTLAYRVDVPSAPPERIEQETQLLGTK